MPTAVIDRRENALDLGGRRVSPLPVTQEIQSRVIAHLKPNRKAVSSDALVKVVADALEQAVAEILTANDEHSHNLRMAILKLVADAEMWRKGNGDLAAPSGGVCRGDEMLSTAEAAEMLGYSRPYVTMLIDKGKLPGATRSEGGHRRVPRSAVLAWKNKIDGVVADDTDYRKAASEADMYALDDEAYTGKDIKTRKK